MSDTPEMAMARRIVDDMWSAGDAKWHEFAVQAALAAIKETTEREWQPIETAPYNQIVEVRAGKMTFHARLVPDASWSDLDTRCDQWQAAIEGEHPPCWSDGACWESNADEVASLQPTAWRALRNTERAKELRQVLSGQGEA